MTEEQIEVDEEIAEMLQAEVHVHERMGPEIGIYSNNIFFSVECRKEDLAVMALALRTDADGFALVVGSAMIEFENMDMTPPDRGEGMVIFALSHVEGGFKHKAMLPHARLLQLLLHGCAGATAEKSKSKPCSGAN